VFVVCVCSGISLQRHVRVHVLPMLRHGSDVPRDPEHYRVAAASRHVTDDDNGRHCFLQQLSLQGRPTNGPLCFTAYNFINIE